MLRINLFIFEDLHTPPPRFWTSSIPHPTSGCHGRNKNPYRGSDQGTGVSHRKQALGLDEAGHLGRQVVHVGLHVVLQD